MSTELTSLRMLIFSSEPGKLVLLSESIALNSDFTSRVFLAYSFKEAVALARKEMPDVILVTLRKTNARECDLVRRFKEQLPGIPLIVISDHDDAAIEVSLIENGAQDFILLENIEHPSFVRRIRYGIARHRYQERILSANRIDSLTGLLNREGLLAMGEQYFKLAYRLHGSLTLMLVKVDDLETIAESEGHRAGEECLEATAHLLRRITRETDLIARIGSDEFAVLMLGRENAQLFEIRKRIQREFTNLNTRQCVPFAFSLSIRLVNSDHSKNSSLPNMLSQACLITCVERIKKKAIREGQVNSFHQTLEAQVP